MSTVKLCYIIRLASIGLKEYLLVIWISAGNLSCQMTDVNFNTIIRVAFYVQKLFTTYSLALKECRQKTCSQNVGEIEQGQQHCNHCLLLSIGWMSS